MAGTLNITQRTASGSCGQMLRDAILTVPDASTGIVVFAHGSGSGRLSPRNRFVARVLNQSGLATLLVDLLTEEEEEDRANVFDIELLASRLIEIGTWLSGDPQLKNHRLGLFGASTGAGAALVAAARAPDRVHAVVSRGGRPDLANADLPFVQAPTLLLVGGDDDVVVELNQMALDRLACTKQLIVIPGASHLFPEPGALEQVAKHASSWFQTYLDGPHEQRKRG